MFGQQVRLVILACFFMILNLFAVLDLRIGYNAFCDDAADDPDFQIIVKSHLSSLRSFYDTLYAHKDVPKDPEVPAQNSSDHQNKAGHVNFLARFNKAGPAGRSELDIFMSLPQEDISIDPIHWWAARRQQFPRLSQLARNILCIPGVYICKMLLMLS
jgi:hypothetical protein